MKGWKFFAPVLLLVIIGMTVYLRLHQPPMILQGEADATNVIVSSKARGRVVDLRVRRGDDVKQGDILLRLDSPEMDAQVAALQSALDQTEARLAESEHGTREEDIAALRAGVSLAQAQLRNAEADHERNAQLVAKGFYSQAQFDQTQRALDVTRSQLREAQANLEKGLRGDRIEQRQALQAAVATARQQLQELKAQADDLVVRAPVDGEVGSIPAEQGELINAYSPLLMLIRLSDTYFVFNMREDVLATIRKGDEVNLQVPGVGNKMVPCVVAYIAPLGDFATKRATRATGDFDLKTFEVRVYPREPVSGLRPGMSALWHWKKQ